jgi:tetratricopeptide (TPR) repeat protein
LDNELHDLVDRGLLFYDKRTKKFDLHPIVRHYAYDRFTESGRKKTHMNLAFHFIDIMPVTNKNVKTLEDLAPVIELYHHMVRAGNLDEACDLLYERLVPNPLHYQFGAYQLMIELKRALFLDGEDKPPRLKREDAQAWTLNALATSYSLSGQPRRAVPLFEQAIKLSEAKGEKKNLAFGLGNVAHIAQIHIGALNASERNLHQMISLAKEIEDEFSQARGHQELGRVLSYRGVWHEAEQELDQSLEWAKKQSHVQMQGLIWSYRALRFLLLARAEPQSKIINLKSSIESAQHALELADETTRTSHPVPRDYVRAHWLLGAAYCMNNELTLAEENLSKALNLCRQINNVESEADILLDLARLRYAQGDFKDAQEKASEALVITERSGYVLQGADVNLFLAQYALEQEKDKSKAKVYAEEAKRLATCDGPPYYYKVAYDEAERMLEKL